MYFLYWVFLEFVLIILSPFFLNGHYIEESAETKIKKSKKKKTTGFVVLQILIRLLSMWLMNVSVSLHLLRHFKLRSDTSSWDPRIHPRMGHSSPRLQTSYYWPAVSQTLLIFSKFVSLEEKTQWYFITENPKCPGLGIKNSSIDGQRTMYVNGSYI